MLARRHIQSAWAPLVIHILLPLIIRSSVPGRREGGREGGMEKRGGREREGGKGREGKEVSREGGSEEKVSGIGRKKS